MSPLLAGGARRAGSARHRLAGVPPGARTSFLGLTAPHSPPAAGAPETGGPELLTLGLPRRRPGRSLHSRACSRPRGDWTQAVAAAQLFTAMRLWLRCQRTHLQLALC